jgi:ankyrin repeat protein
MFAGHLTLSPFLGVNTASAGGQKLDKKGFFKAVRAGDLTVVLAHLDGGQDVDAVEGDGSTALMLAVVAQNDDLASLLLDRGANPNLADKQERVPLMYAGNRFWIERMGIFNVPRSQARDTPITETLLVRGANPNAAARDGRTSLHIAVDAENLASIRLLLKKGANVNAADKNGVTPLIAAAQGLSAPVASELCAAGASKSARTRKGQTAMEVAQSRKDKDLDRLRAEFMTALEKCQ